MPLNVFGVSVAGDPEFDLYVQRRTGAVVEVQRCDIAGCGHFDVWAAGSGAADVYAPDVFRLEFALLGVG